MLLVFFRGHLNLVLGSVRSMKCLMRKIQVDMFEVQLGAALLLQFKTNAGKTVRVLADAGVSATGYQPDHVHRKLAGAFSAFEEKAQRLDLIIGTHYDADHLEGLVPIIEDSRIDIGEAWMPPVANDTEIHALEESVQDRHLLGRQLAGEAGKELLYAYLRAKADVCKELQDLERMADEYESLTRTVAPEQYPNIERWEGSLDVHVNYFERHIKDADETLSIWEHTHADEDIEAPPPTIPNWGRVPRHYILDLPFPRPQPYWSDSHRREFFRHAWSENHTAAIAQARSIAYIRRAAAKDAINATSLYKVVTALKARKIPTSYQMIEDGRPRRFVWKAQCNQFVPGANLNSDGPELMLLGPSESLVKKHWNKLPIGDYLAMVAFTSIPIKSITASNQLSYVARFSANEQGLLVCGDAGCVDFKAERGNYHKELISSLLPLHIIQIAHHGGNNARFYNVLLEAGYAAQTDQSLLLLSHAEDDKFRPSKEFGWFIEKVRKEGDDIQLLFTSRPTADKVKDYQQIIHPVVGAPNAVGDIRIQFDGNHWLVISHAVRV